VLCGYTQIQGLRILVICIFKEEEEEEEEDA